MPDGNNPERFAVLSLRCERCAHTDLRRAPVMFCLMVSWDARGQASWIDAARLRRQGKPGPGGRLDYTDWQTGKGGVPMLQGLIGAPPVTGESFRGTQQLRCRRCRSAPRVARARLLEWAAGMATLSVSPDRTVYVSPGGRLAASVV